MNPMPRTITGTTGVVLETNKVLRQTYTLLAATLLFSGVLAAISMAVKPPAFTGLICSLAAMALIWFVLPRTANSASGLGVVFGITGLLGFGLGPLLSQYVGLPNGSQVIMTAMGGTGVIFLGLSAYAVTTKRDFSFMGGMLVVGILLALVAMVANIFLAIPALSLTISAVMVLLMSGFILYDTGRIVNGGETNYVMATVSIYLSIYNLFVSLLQLLGVMGNDE